MNHSQMALRRTREFPQRKAQGKYLMALYLTGPISGAKVSDFPWICWDSRSGNGYTDDVMAPRKAVPDESGHYVVIDGRRWRATDPSIPEERRRELVSELMSARRAVGSAKRSGDQTAEAAARDRVHAAKVALGERGPKWWRS